MVRVHPRLGHGRDRHPDPAPRRLVAAAHENPYLLAAVPTALVYRFTRSFLGAMLAGVASFLAFSYLLGQDAHTRRRAPRHGRPKETVARVLPFRAVRYTRPAGRRLVAGRAPLRRRDPRDPRRLLAGTPTTWSRSTSPTAAPTRHTGEPLRDGRGGGGSGSPAGCWRPTRPRRSTSSSSGTHLHGAETARRAFVAAVGRSRSYRGRAPPPTDVPESARGQAQPDPRHQRERQPGVRPVLGHQQRDRGADGKAADGHDAPAPPTSTGSPPRSGRSPWGRTTSSGVSSRSAGLHRGRTPPLHDRAGVQRRAARDGRRGSLCGRPDMTAS